MFFPQEGGFSHNVRTRGICVGSATHGGQLGPPMTLSNMRQLGVYRLFAALGSVGYGRAQLHKPLECRLSGPSCVGHSLEVVR